MTWRELTHLPLIRLLAVNLAAGFAAAALMLAGLIALNPFRLRELMLADGPTAFVLLLFGLTVTFGSAAMGSAVMMLGRRDGGGGTGRRKRTTPRVVPAKAKTR
jgi:hypothetical protein